MIFGNHFVFIICKLKQIHPNKKDDDSLINVAKKSIEQFNYPIRIVKELGCKWQTSKAPNAQIAFVLLMSDSPLCNYRGI